MGIDILGIDIMAVDILGIDIPAPTRCGCAARFVLDLPHDSYRPKKSKMLNSLCGSSVCLCF